MKHIVSVSLGSATRDFSETLELLGEQVRLERRGVGGDPQRAAALIRDLDGQVDAIGLGGTDLYFYIGKRRYTMRQSAHLAAEARSTPVVCGAGLKGSLEPQAVRDLDARFGLRGKRVLLVSAVDRFPMAQAFTEIGADVRFGDLAFALGLPYLIRSLTTLRLLAYALLPLITLAPISLLYPTGGAQEEHPTFGVQLYRRAYAWAEVIAGDWHFIRRYLPPRLDGKIILTNTTTPKNVELLRERGAAWLVTTTPRIEGRSLSANALEAAFVAVSGGVALTPEALGRRVTEAALKTSFVALNP